MCSSQVEVLNGRDLPPINPQGLVYDLSGDALSLCTPDIEHIATQNPQNSRLQNDGRTYSSTKLIGTGVTISPVQFVAVMLQFLLSNGEARASPEKAKHSHATLDILSSAVEILLRETFIDKEKNGEHRELPQRKARSNSRREQTVNTVTIKRHVQGWIGDRVKQNTPSNTILSAVIIQELKHHYPAYYRTLHALPLVFQHMPISLKSRLAAKAKSKSFRMATKILKHCGLYFIT